tara:strand:+ start:176 stop:514 length:339 start_codon:yes stop_codon:yes gene_type:complete
MSNGNELQDFNTLDSGEIMKNIEVKAVSAPNKKQTQELQRAIRESSGYRIPLGEVNEESINKLPQKDQDKIRETMQYRIYSKQLQASKEGKMRETLESIMEREGKNIRGEEI